MPLSEAQCLQLQQFFNHSNFAEKGAVITDLDGTAIHEYKGSLAIPKSVELGLKKINDLGRPVIINTLRFPLSVMRTFGKDWYSISNAPVPTVLMNGSMLGYMIETREGEIAYEEIKAFVLDNEEIKTVMQTVNALVEGGVEDVLVFYYPRDWRCGEIIWTPVNDRIPSLQKKYLSASSVISVELNALEALLHKQDICMVFLLIEIPQDQLMAYQHTKKNNFFTHKGVDKLYGSEQIAAILNVKMEHCLGSGDSEMDTFLQSVGQAVHVGNPFLKYTGILPPIKLAGSSELGELFFTLAEMQRTIIQ